MNWDDRNTAVIYNELYNFQQNYLRIYRKDISLVIFHTDLWAKEVSGHDVPMGLLVTSQVGIPHSRRCPHAQWEIKRM